jgi:hypothetical protein
MRTSRTLISLPPASGEQEYGHCSGLAAGASVTKMSTHGQSGRTTTATIDDLSQAILAWLDQRPPGLVRRSPSATWSSPELRDTFRANLERALSAAVSAMRLADVISYLIDAFTAVTTSSVVSTSRWSVALREGSSVETFDAMRDDVAQLLQRKTGEQDIPDVPPVRFADLIVHALNDALSDEAERIPGEDMSPEGVLSYYMIPPDVRRTYNVRTFLFFLGTAVIAFIIYAIIEPDSWFNPGTGLFILLAYATLIATAIVYDRSRAGTS